jgi:hypothetical protein
MFICFSRNSRKSSRKENQKTSQNNKQHSVPPLANGFIEYDFEMLLNATKGVLQMAEAIASHTRWIPYIFHNLQFVEGQINNTLSSSKHMCDELLLKVPPQSFSARSDWFGLDLSPVQLVVIHFSIHV